MGKDSHRLFLFVDKEAKHMELNLAGYLKYDHIGLECKVGLTLENELMKFTTVT